MDEAPERLGALLTEHGWTIAVAETTTGGLICSRIVGVPGSSKYFERGVIAYSRQSKLDLGLSEDLLSDHGAVSEETARSLAESVRREAGTDFGLAETGIAGPVQGRSQKPLGTAYVAVAGPAGCDSFEVRYEGGRDAVRSRIADAALAAVSDTVERASVTA